MKKMDEMGKQVKKRVAWTLLAAASALAVLLCACGGGAAYGSPSSSAASYAPAAADTTYATGYKMEAENLMETGEGMYVQASMAPEPLPELEAEAGEEMDAPAGEAAAQPRKIVKHTNLSLETMEFDQALEELIQLVESSGGYIESQNVDGRSIRKSGGYYSRSAQIGARIPADKLDGAVSTVGGLCNIVSKNENVENITDRYYDAQAHLKSLNLQEERLLEILSKAEKLEDVVTLEQALGNVRYEIETLTATLRRMDADVSYSYLNMDLIEVVEYNEPLETPKTFGQRLAAAADRSVRLLSNSVQDATLTLVEVGPVSLLWIVIFGGIGLLIFRLVRRSVRKRRKAAAAKPGANPAQPAAKSDEPAAKSDEPATHGETPKKK